jgi:hypothetical protein
VICSRHYITLHRGACTGELQARRERKQVLKVPEGLIEASTNIVVKVESAWVSVVCRPPAARELAPPFIGQGEGDLQACRTVLATCDGMARSAVE